MKQVSRAKGGFTIAEVLISVSVIALVLVAFLGVLVISQEIASYSRHKVQAMYAAQRIVEEQRRLAFATLASQASAAISIDTRGTFNTTADDFMGTRRITVTTLDTYRKRLAVEVDWIEHTFRGNVTMREFCTTDIANEPQLN